MKRTITTVMLVLVTIGYAAAQCMPEIDFDGTGLTLSPAQLNPVYACGSCGDHERIISLQTFADTTLSVEIQPGNPPLEITVFADWFRLDSIAGLPEGLTFTTDAAFDTTYDPVENPLGYWFNSGDTTVGFTNTTGCISIQGDAAAWTAALNGGPNNDGIYPMTFFIDARAADFDPQEIAGTVGYNTWLTEMGPLLAVFGDPNFTENGIKLAGPDLVVVQSGVGISEAESPFEEVIAIPNPTNGITSLKFHYDGIGVGQIQVFSLEGKLIRSDAVRLANGNNIINLDYTGLDAGVYSVSLTSNKRVATTKLILK